MTIGRLTTADFSVAADAHMSRNHLIVEGLSHSFRLRDVGSSNGTFVNDLPISVVELCTGDRIKAGTSVFEVALELGEDDAAPMPASDDLMASIPIRTLSSQDLGEAIEEVTLRYSMREGASEEELPPQAETQMLVDSGAFQPFAPSPASEPDRGESITNKSNEPANGSQASFQLAAPLWEEFKPLSSGVTWQQFSPEDRFAADRILSKLLAQSSGAPASGVQSSGPQYSLIVNRSQLDGAELGALDFLLSTREARLLTGTLCVVESRKPENVIEIFKRCLGKDAAILIASTEPLSNSWLGDAIDTLSYPSLLADVLKRDPQRAAQLAQQVYFMLYEARNHELGLLCGQRPAANA